MGYRSQAAYHEHQHRQQGHGDQRWHVLRRNAHEEGFPGVHSDSSRVTIADVTSGAGAYGSWGG